MKSNRTGIEVGLIGLMWFAIIAITPRSFEIDWPMEFWLKQFFVASLLIITYYINIRFLLPKFFGETKYLQYILIIAILTTFVLLSSSLFEIQIGLPRKMHEIFRPDKPFDPERNRISFSFGTFTLALLNFSIGTITYLLRTNQMESEKRKELEKLQVSTELSYLKAQINPHFFFNTLNNIYALTAIDSEASREAILKLSSMMRYVISEEKSTESTVNDEIKFISNYIELMKLRLPKRAVVKFSSPENPPDLKIAPMILQPFVENAFKYGVSSSTPTEILISIAIEHSTLNFTVENRIVPQPEVTMEDNGIGLSNTRRRLDLLYPGSHNLNLVQEDGTFKVSLSINL